MKALEPRLNRYVAIKLMSPVFTSNGSSRRRFEREGRAVAAVSHEHVVPIYAVDEHDGLPYIVMKYIPGLSLEQRIERDGPLGNREVPRIGLQVAEGLAAAHAQGIVHRDGKPANVIMESTVDRAMVTDFGLARFTDEASMTRSGTITGTPQYISPEQARGDAVDERTDLFSLGSLMYAACCGHPPFRAETVYGVINRVCEAQPRAIREINPEIDEWLEAFIMKLIAKLPDERFRTASGVAMLLSAELAYLQNPTGAASPPRDWYTDSRASGSDGKYKRIGAMIFAVGAVAFAGYLASPFGESDQNENPTDAMVAGLGNVKLNKGANALAVPTVSLAIEWANWDEQSESAFERTFEQTLSQTFAVGYGGTLKLRADRGDVDVTLGEPGRFLVTITRSVKADSQAAAKQLVEHHHVKFRQDGDDLTLDARVDEGSTLPAQLGDLARVHFAIEMPPGFESDVQTDEGSIFIGEVSGDVNAMACAGDIQFARVNGAIKAETKGGSVSLLEGCEEYADIMVMAASPWCRLWTRAWRRLVLPLVELTRVT
jgi:hypothetical protein